MPRGDALTRAELTSARARVLVIVARDQPDLWWYLTRDFAGFKGVKVVLDRRQGGWWQRAQLRELQERGADRRSPFSSDTDLRNRALLIIHRQDGDPQGKLGSWVVLAAVESMGPSASRLRRSAEHPLAGAGHSAC